MPNWLLDERELKCPHCNGEYLHHTAVVVYCRLAEDSDEVIKTEINLETRSTTVVMATNEGNPSHRRDGLAIRFHCELCPEYSELTIAQHKGQTLVCWKVDNA